MSSGKNINENRDFTRLLQEIIPLLKKIIGTVFTVTGTVSVAEPVTVDAVDLDIRNLSSATDSVTVVGSISIPAGVDTELPPAAALTDNMANPTAPAVGSFGMVFDGATWDRVPGTTADGQLVNLGANNDVVVSGVVDTELTTKDLDTGGGTDTQAVVGLLIAASGGATVVSAANPLPVTGSGTAYTEAVAAAANPVGAAQILVSDSTPALEVAEGENVARRGTRYGAAYAQIVSSAGAFIDTFGGGTQYTEDAASVADPVGTQLIARRRDALVSETTADGDVTALNSTAKGELYVKQTDSVPITAAALPLPAGAATSALQTQPGVDIGDVTVNNAAGAAAVNVQDGGNSLTVDGAVTANAGTNLNTSLLALEAGGNLAAIAASASVLDDWDETDRAKVNLIAAQAGITGGAGGVAANTPRVTHASDDPVTVAAQIMDDWDESDRAKVNPVVGVAGVAAGAGAVGTNTQRVTHASDDPVTTSVQLIDDAIIADNAAFTDGTTKLSMAGHIFDDVAGTALTENDAVASRVDSKRAQVHVVEDATTRGLRQGVVDETGASAVDAAAVGGGTPHDAVDSGNPVKIGVKVTDYEPDTSGEQGTAVAAADRANAAANLNGEIVAAVRSAYWVPTNIATTYDDSPTTATSDAIECWAYRQATFGCTLARANTPTDLLFEILISMDNGATFVVYRNGPLGAWIHSAGSIGAAGRSDALSFPICCHSMKIRVTATGSTASNTFTLTDPVLYFRT